MEVECPVCETEHDVGDDLPSCASEYAEFTCETCGTDFKLHWYATAELVPVTGKSILVKRAAWESRRPLPDKGE